MKKDDFLKILGKSAEKHWVDNDPYKSVMQASCDGSPSVAEKAEALKPLIKPLQKLNGKISSSNDAYKHLLTELYGLDHERFIMITLNRANMVLGVEVISSGGTSGTVCDPKIIFRKALLAGAAAIIVGHNHPSGQLQPSQADVDLTRKIKKAGEFLTLPVLDHIIVTDNGYYSFADEGNL